MGGGNQGRDPLHGVPRTIREGPTVTANVGAAHDAKIEQNETPTDNVTYRNPHPLCGAITTQRQPLEYGPPYFQQASPR